MKVNLYKILGQSFLIAFLFLYSCSERADILAKVDNVIITETEFINAYQFNPHLSSITDDNLAKIKTLETLLVQKLLVSNAPDATKKDILIEKQVQQIEREALIENFWQLEIFPKVEIREKDVYQAYQNSKIKKIARLYVFDEEIIVNNFYEQMLQKGNKNLNINKNNVYVIVDTLSTISSPQAVMSKVSPLKIGEFSKPFQWGSMYYIAENINEVRDIGSSENEFEEQKEKIIKNLSEQKAKEIFDQIINNDKNKTSYEINRSVLKNVINKLLDNFETLNNLQGNVKKLFDTETETFDKSKIVIRFSDGTNWTPQILLERIQISSYPLSYKNKTKLRQSLLLAIKNILDDEIIVKRTLKNKPNLEYVNEEKRVWRDYFIYQDQIKKILRQEKEAQSYLLSLAKGADIEVKTQKLKALKIPRTNMVVLKKQFPGRNLNPTLQPLKFDKLSNYLHGFIIPQK